MAARWMLNLTALLLLCGLSACSEAESSAPVEVTPDATHLEVTIKGETFNLELALDDATRTQGLSDRPEIPADGGMLFVFPDQENRAFVMRRCLVPIDIAFLNAEGEVVWMHAMQIESDPDAPDYRLKQYKSHYPAQFAIEVKDQTLRRLGLSQGDRIELPLEALKGRAE